jgi:hypothetical protein
MFCVANRNMCSGCITESLRHKKTLQLEHELLQDSSSNTILAQIPVLLLTGTTLKQFRRTLQHLPTLANKKRDDPIYGAARYLANSIGILINEATSQESLDAPMTAKKQDIWRQAKLHCKCNLQHDNISTYGNRSFCNICSYLIFRSSISHVTTQRTKPF